MEQYFPVGFNQAVPVHHVPMFARKYKINRGIKKWRTLLFTILLALELLDDYEVEISEVLDEEDDITLFSVGSSYMRRNLQSTQVTRERYF